MMEPTLNARLLTDVTCVPPSADPNYSRRAPRGGLYRRRVVVNDAMLLVQDNATVSRSVLGSMWLRPERTLPTPVVFGGYLNNQYGHFLLESLARLWIAAELRDMPIVYLNLAK